MTLEEERYLEECRRRLKPDQVEAVGVGLNYGIPLEEIQKVVNKNLNGNQMRQIMFALMEGVSGQALEFLLTCDAYNHYQLKEVTLGFMHGLSLEQVKTYAGRGTSAHQMKKMRLELEKANNLELEAAGDDGLKEYLQSLMEIMEQSLKQFRDSNQRFDSLSALVKEHVVDEKNSEIKDLYESLQAKDGIIRKLNTQLEEKNKEIEALKSPKSSKSKIKEKEAENKEIAVSADKQEYRTKKRLDAWFSFAKKNDKVLAKLVDSELSAEQMEEVRKCVAHGLDYQEINQIIKGGGTPEKMQKLREIILLMKARKEGV